MQPKTKQTRATDGQLLIARREAACRLNMSLRSFERYVQPHIAMIRRRLVEARSGHRT
jgi:hypothetical protein